MSICRECMGDWMDESAWAYLVALRRDILGAMGRINDAGDSLWWDDTTPNSTTRTRLSTLLEKALGDGAAFGIFVVTRHTDCGRRSHRRAADEHEYVWADRYGLNVKWRDDRFVWEGDQLFQGLRYSDCPCSPPGEPIHHHVIDDFIYSPSADPTFYRTVTTVLCDLASAIEEAGDKKPRSGIREYLLRAVLRLNDAILPVSVERHIQQRLQAPRTDSQG